jgi:tetratricopeptide (TPR) repeat protein
LTVYRGQLIPSIELESLKNAEGGLIAMTSFVSTTRDHEVATIFAGNGAKPPNFEPVIFEIYIEQSDLEQERRPFADISEVSSKGKDEDEILLCMGTVMRIESVELSEEMSRIRLRTCPYNDSAWQYSKMGLLPCESSNSLDETYSLMTLGMLLFSMDECKKAEQFYSMINSSSDPVIKKMCQFYLIATRARETKMFDLDYSSNMMMGICEMQKVIQSMANCESILDFCPEICKLQMQDIATFFELIKLKGAHSVNSFKLIEKYNELLEIMLRFGPMLDSPIFHSSLIEPVRLFSENTESNDEQIKSIRYDRMKSNMDKILSENDSSRSDIFYRMALSAVKEGNYDRAIAFVRDGLSITSNYNNGIDVELYNLLVIIYKKQKNWPAVIESCQSIIDMPQIPPSSSAIVKAHIERGDACIELDDLSEAFLSYTNALELQKQHHAPNHPLTSEIHINIGNVFEKKGNVSAALESYNEAITLGSPDTASTAYKNIGVMYMRRGNHDLARSNFIKCLEIQEGSIPHKTFLIACIHLWLARLEHKTEHYEQRDFHIQQSRKIADHDEENHKWITEQISRILG